MAALKTPISKRPARAANAVLRGLIFAALLLTIPSARSMAQSTNPQVSTLEGRTVVEIRVVDDSSQPIKQVPQLPLKEGGPFHFAAERESLRQLYATGDFANVRVTADAAESGLRISFIVTRDFYNNVVRIYGLKEPPSEPAAQAALRLTLGIPFREAALKEGVNRLETVLHDEGFYQAKITYDLLPHADTRQMDVNIRIDSGPRAKIGVITVQNHTKYVDSEILRRAGLRNKNGKTEMTTAQRSRSRDKLRKFLVNQGYLGASTLITPGTYDPSSNRVPLELDVTAGPRIQIEVTGAGLSSSQRKRLLPIYAEGAVDEDLVQEGRRNIRDYFQRQGYFNAGVGVSSTPPNAQGEQSIVYTIDRGERFRLVGIAFDGNHYFSRALLTQRLQLQTASFASYGRFSQQLMRQDTDSIRNLYLTNGFRKVQATSEVAEQSAGKKNDLLVKFHVVEGTQTRVSSLQIDGNSVVSTDDLMTVIGSTEGQPYSEAGVASDRNNVLAYYYNDGFPEATFQEEILDGEADGPNEVALKYHITEGQRILVSQVLLTGYQYTRQGIISRQVEVKAGGPLREGDVVDSERQLYNLGIFNRVQIAPQNPDGTDPQKTVVTDVREGNRYTIGYGVGFEVQRIAGGSTNPNGYTIGASPRGIFEIARSNMFGRAQTLSFSGRASTLEYRATISYSGQNFLNNRKLSLQLTGYADKSQDVNTFTSTRYQGGLELVQKASPSSSFVYQYYYRRVLASELSSTINPEQIPLLSQPTLVSGFALTYARDRRDNPADARKGNFTTIDLNQAIRAIGSSADFFRLSFQNSSYHPFGRAFVFARSIRFGFEQPFDGTVAPDDPSCAVSCNTIPLPERLFAGGGSSLRGFGLNQAGPRDPVTGFPVGGLAMLIFNQELRFPMKLPFIGNRLGGTIFYDGGNIFSDIHHITLAWKSPSVTDLNYFSHTVGFGVRYATPVGPVRVDIGYQLNPAQYQAQVTDPVTKQVQTQVFRLPHIGFFFNIGSIF